MLYKYSKRKRNFWGAIFLKFVLCNILNKEDIGDYTFKTEKKVQIRRTAEYF